MQAVNYNIGRNMVIMSKRPSSFNTDALDDQLYSVAVKQIIHRMFTLSVKYCVWFIPWQNAFIFKFDTILYYN